ncbi:hypothetical protein AEQ67_21925 [Pseudomonas sp. RIT-PI-q]|uniref:hypothetical protein n=1 Tax=Pseudomonas sp. RIT-PI-q TaxID=1690247 RepID=UPI0006CC4E19|nr:hypothetical protein [Pseudomonas sp. RIT-PI-q]KPG94810.1 hypothetical protein AEQ67_21925 [Pseudomonas sp. RIT-PI-q]
MDKKYLIKHWLAGVAYLITAIVAFYIGDALFYKNIGLVISMVLSTLLYPISRYLITATAYKLTGPELWKKGFFVKGDVSGVNALFAFICIVLAIPLGGCYLIYITCKKG